MIIQLIIPFFFSLLSIIMHYPMPLIGIISSAINVFLCISTDSYNTIYEFGNWFHEIGISHSYDLYKSHISLIINALFLIYHILYYNFLSNISYVLYSIILLLYFGVLGMLFTNDLFNLYVFLEVISLCSVIIIAYDNYKAALEYLIYGGLFATISLASIAIIMGTQNTLVLSNIQPNTSLTSDIAITTFILGLIGKIGLYTLQLFKSKIATYKYANIDILPIISISSIILSFKIYECMSFIVYTDIIIALCIYNCLYSGYKANNQSNIRNVFFYSAMSSNGYLIIAIVYLPSIAISVIINEFIAKFFLFHFLKFCATQNINDLYKLKTHKIIYYALLITIFSSAGLPITNGFFIKISILQKAIQNIYIFIFILISMGISVNYHWRILYHLYLLPCNSSTHTFSPGVSFLYISYIVYMIFGSLFYLNIID